jgi:hypothetical protein
MPFDNLHDLPRLDLALAARNLEQVLEMDSLCLDHPGAETMIGDVSPRGTGEFR